MRSKTFFTLFLFITLVGAVSCVKQDADSILKQTDVLPVVDGVIGDSEYTVTIETAKMTLHLARNSETLVFGLKGHTMGWTAIGFGAMGMDKSHMIIGYVTGDTMSVEEHEGIGHGHLSADRQILIDSVITETDGTTVFEGAVRAREVINADKTGLSIIVACGTEDNFTSRHIFRKSLMIPLTDK